MTDRYASHAPPRFQVDGAKPGQSELDALDEEATRIYTAPARTGVGARSAGGGLGRTAGVLFGLALCLGATYALPALSVFRPWTPGSSYVPFWNLVGREWLGEGPKLEAEARRLANLRRATELPAAASAKVGKRVERPENPVFPAYSPPTSIVRPEHEIERIEALNSYYEKLTLADLGIEGAIARTGHWGDSVLGMDGITSGIRRRLQARFGDAGVGFHLMDRYHPSYRQQDVEFSPGGGWNGCLIINECRKQDRRYGYGGHVVFSEPWTSASAAFRTPARGFGSRVSTFELWFARHERGGKIEIAIDGEEPVVLDTKAPELQDAWHTVYAPEGQHRFVVRTLIGGSVRAYGVLLENDGPGVVWEGMALIGGSTRGLRTQDRAHIAAQVRRRGLDLIAFMFGGNDLARKYVDLKESLEPYYAEYTEVVRNFRAGRPSAACLIMSVIDHGERRADDSIVSKSFAKVLANAQREVARRAGCAFFDTFQAMGGTGSAGRWYRANPRLMAPDLGHPTGSGHEVIAGLFSHALLYGYDQYRMKMAGKPLRLPPKGGNAASSDGVRPSETDAQ